MKKIALFAVSCILINSLFAQDSTVTVVPKKKQPINLAGRANDHLLLTIWLYRLGRKARFRPNKGFSQSFNIYFMFDFPF
jgi:hypothetical protein